MTALVNQNGERLGSSEGVEEYISTMATECELNFETCLHMLETSAENQLSSTTVDSSHSSSDESSDDEKDKWTVELDGIQKSINELDRLAIHIRQSSDSSLDTRVKAFGSRKVSKVSSFEAKAMLVVKGLYPEASESLHRHLSKSMTQRYIRLLYWRSHDKKLRTDHRRDKKPPDKSRQMPLEKSSPPEEPARDSRPASAPKTSRSGVSAGTSFQSGTQASDPEPRLNKSASPDAETPARRRAGASTVLGSKANFPSPPDFEDGEDRKPCPLCRKMFLKTEFGSNVWWRCHVNDDLLPFPCISSQCLGSPNFASLSEWREHNARDHGVLWSQGPSGPIGVAEHPESSDVGRLAHDCPLCHLPLDQ
ncbi:hypothetical protein BDP55DRAFT_561963, partial [Colletotrichum godetiae]